MLGTILCRGNSRPPSPVPPKNAQMARSVLELFFKIRSRGGVSSPECKIWVKTPCFFYNLWSKIKAKITILVMKHVIRQKLQKIRKCDFSVGATFRPPTLILTKSASLERSSSKLFLNVSAALGTHKKLWMTKKHKKQLVFSITLDIYLWTWPYMAKSIDKCPRL